MTAEYALRAIAELARNTAVLNSDELSARTLVPRPYLVKVLQKLAADGLVESSRGKTGGWSLNAAKAADLTIYDVLESVAPIHRITECPIRLAEHARQLCPMHAALDAAFEQLEKSFRKAKVMDLVDTSVTVEGLVSGLSRMHRLHAAKRRRGASPKSGRR